MRTTSANPTDNCSPVTPPAGQTATSPYDPFGRPLTAVGQDFNNEFGWQGGQVAAGFWHFGARYYINSQGRFTQPDPQTHPTDPTQYNPYVFGNDDPINESDPGGERAIHPSPHPPTNSGGIPLNRTDTCGLLGIGIGVLDPVVGAEVGVGCIAAEHDPAVNGH
jgi:RHS repeat-associated protein